MNAPANIDFSALVQPSPGGFGAVISHPDFDALSAEPAFLAEIVPLLGRHLVIRIDAPPFRPEALGRLQAMLGVAAPNKAPRLAGFEHIIEFDTPAKPDADPKADADAAQIMHHDSIGIAEPAAFAIVNTKTNPAKPPTYSWIDMQAVYRDLPEAMKQRINTLSVIHPSYPDIVSARVHRDVASLPSEARDNGQRHPLVVRNPRSGQPALMLSVRRDAKIPGMADAQSLTLLTELWAIVEASPHRWQSPLKGDEIFIWDNIATVHDRPPLSSAEPRKVWFANLGPQKPLPAFAA